MNDNHKQEDKCKCLFNEPFFDLDEYIRGKNINFLIGAGASADVYKTLNIVNGLSFEDIISLLNWTDFEKQALYLYFYFEVIHPMFEIYKYEPKIRNTKSKFKSKGELTNLFLKYQTLLKYQTFLKGIYIFLQNESNDTPRKINIFSTNYDLLFEYAYDSISAKFPLSIFNDGSKGIFNKIININNFYFSTNRQGANLDYKYSIPTINLLKLHGSISWISNSKTKNESSKIKNIWNLEEISNAFSNFDENFAEIKTLIEQIKLHNPNQLTKEDFQNQFKSEMRNSSINEDELKCFWEEYKNISIINPNKDKFFDTLFQQHYFESLRFFNYELEKQQTILIVFGFSFKDEHIRDIIKRSLFNKKLTVITIPYQYKDYEYINKEFEGFDNFKYLLCHNKKCKYNIFENQKEGNFDFLLETLFKTRK